MKRRELVKVLEMDLQAHLAHKEAGPDLSSVIGQLKGNAAELKVLLDEAFVAVEERVTRGIPLGDALIWLNQLVTAVSEAQHSLQQPNVDAYFGHECREQLVTLLPRARSTLDICVYTITDRDVGTAILNAKRTRVKVRVITDLDKVDANGSDIRYLEKNGVFMKVNSGEAIMHHKFAIIDSRTLITGSYNWTVGAATQNSENFIVTDAPQAIEAFQQEFNSLWERCRWLST
ncbi:DUF1669 domain-containing protein [Myxococcota bacterium]|nr:DUF1669 domain-containing protein [Myxococcota bacterium]MBU1537143.1 DUF1669 domain-containing protein [Myxococcota bacterium]